MMLVTGGTGYLGSHLARELLEKGEPVRILDVHKTKYLPEGAEFIQGDMRDKEVARKAVKDVEKVFHLAFVQSLSKLPESECWDINFNGTENLLKASLDAGVDRFIYTSTIEIYGTKPPFPCPEDAPKDEPVGWYGRHKLEVENLVWKYYKEKGLKATAVRMPTICGPGYYNHRPLLQLMDRVLDNKILAVVGKGDTYGDLVYYKDVLQGYLLAGEKKEAIGEPFNISCDVRSTQLEMVQAMIDEVGSKSRVLHLQKFAVRGVLRFAYAFRLTDLPKYQFEYLFHHNSYSVDKAKKLLGYAPTKSAAESARELIKGYVQDREFVKHRSENY
jgi:UDP-glucose 4-epimerase